jgi:hypothetical protein
VKTAKRAAMLHDLGKALTHEIEGSHALISAQFARRYGETQHVVHAIEAHHYEVQPQTVEAVLVIAADAISASRPGARGESLEHYIKRLESLEELAAKKPGVEKVYALQQVRFRLLQRQAGNALELDLLVELRMLQLVLKLAQVDLTVREALVLPGQVDELALDLLLFGEHALFDLQHRLPPVGELGVDLRPQLDGLFSSLDLRFPAQRLGLPLGVLDQLAPDSPRLADAGRAEDLNREECKSDPCSDSNGDSDPDQHERGSSVGLPHPSPPASQFPRSRSVSVRAHARVPQKPAYLAVILRRLRVD